MNTPTPFEEIVNKYPLNTFSGETKKELLVLLAAVHDSALEKAREAVENSLEGQERIASQLDITLAQLRINQ